MGRRNGHVIPGPGDLFAKTAVRSLLDEQRLRLLCPPSQKTKTVSKIAIQTFVGLFIFAYHLIAHSKPLNQ